jgi:cystathionine beta-lyase/cystathionine gamma-synthase
MSDRFDSLNKGNKSSYRKITTLSSEAQMYDGISPSIAMTSNFHRSTPTKKAPTDYVYSRTRNPNFNLFENQLCELHNGFRALAFASGMAAISATLGAACKKNSNIICSNEHYGELSDCLNTLERIGDIKTTYVDICNFKEVIETIKQTEDLALLYLESATNPTARIADLSLLVKEVNKIKPDCLVVVDNTWLSPEIYRPLDMGADIVIESATKYISGRGDIVAGAVVVKKRITDFPVFDTFYYNLRQWRRVHGASPNPISCWLLSKSLETLPIRIREVSKTAMEVAEFLEELPFINRVLYAGLKSHPTYKIAKRDLKNMFGGIIYFHLSVNLEEAFEIIDNFNLIINATSYGEAHALVNLPKEGNTILYPDDPENGVPDKKGCWFRVYVGLQSPNEILIDLMQAISNIMAVTLAKVHRFYKDHQVVEFEFENDEELPLITEGSILIHKGEPHTYYEVIDKPRVKELESTKLLTLKISGSMKKKMEISYIKSN